jgi:hypothetical protein
MVGYGATHRTFAHIEVKGGCHKQAPTIICGGNFDVLIHNNELNRLDYQLLCIPGAEKVHAGQAA